MSAPAHTPGEWWIAGKGTIRAGEMDWVAQVHHRNRTANARLIAAAPELLEALEAFVSGDIDVSGTALIYDADLRAMLALARAAIAKARDTNPTPEVSHVG